MNYLDWILVILILFGAFKGWRSGVVTRAVSLVGMIAILVISYYIKNPLSIVLYTKLPFLSFKGVFSGITSFNIIVYELVSYIVIVALLGLILLVILKLTGLIDKLIQLTIIFSIPSKILGALLGALQYYLIGFVIVVVCTVVPGLNKSLDNSTFSVGVVSNTPIISEITKNVYLSVNEIYDICVDYKGSTMYDKQRADYESLNVLLKYEIITPDAVRLLKDKRKLTFDNIDELLEKYDSDENDDQNIE